ncbi:MAG: mechanosensitive ion channel [Symploca sp. SIO2D2]|nr:mechanosensitive ion channel [Symploca sp. SIO2D2]
MNSRLRYQSLFRQFARIVLVALAISYLLSVTPVFAQENTTAPIILDGRILFEVNQSGEYTAKNRADDANTVLREQVTKPEPPVEVKIEYREGLPVIFINDKYLLSVTSADALNIELKAEQWKKKLQRAIEKAQYQRSNAYIRNAIFLSLGSILLAIICIYGLNRVWRRWLKPLLPAEMTDLPRDSRRRLILQMGVKILTNVIKITPWLLCTIYTTDLFPQTRELSHNITNTIINTLIGSLTGELIPLGDKSYSIIGILIFLGLFAGLIFLARTAKQLFRSRLLHLTGLNRGTQETVAQIANYALIFFGTIVLLQLAGLDLSSLTIFASVIGVGIGLGLQGIAKEFISGLVLIFERPIQVGDFVNIEGLMGTVERISVRSTEIRTMDAISVIVPNSRFLESEVINWTHQNPVSRLTLPVGVAYGINLHMVREALIQAAKEHPDVLPQPEPQVLFKGFGDNSLDFDLLVWIANPPQQFKIKSDLYFRIEEVLRDRSLEIPFPQRDLHIRSGSVPLEISPQLSESLSQLSTSLTKWLELQSNTNNWHKNDSSMDSQESS